MAKDYSAYPKRYLPRLDQVAYIRPMREILQIDPLTDLEKLGFLEPRDISGSFSHLSLRALDQHGEPLFDIHGLASHPVKGLGEMGDKKSRLVCLPLSAHHKSKHRRKAGPILEIKTAVRDGAKDRIERFIAASLRHPLPYSVPANVVREKLIEFSGNIAALSFAEREPMPTFLREYVCGTLLKLPLPVFARVAYLFTKWPVRNNGCNSNSIAANVASLFGLNLQDYYTRAEAPLINARAHRYLRAAQVPAPMPKTIHVIQPRPPLILPPVRETVRLPGTAPAGDLAFA